MHKFYIHYLLGFNLIKSKYKKIKNKVKILARLRKSKIRIIGDNNILSIHKNSFIKKSSFLIDNNNNIIILKKKSLLKNSHIIVEGTNNVIYINKETSLRNKNRGR
jgi:transferase, hexapeptide repeat family